MKLDDDERKARFEAILRELKEREGEQEGDVNDEEEEVQPRRPNSRRSKQSNGHSRPRVIGVDPPSPSRGGSKGQKGGRGRRGRRSSGGGWGMPVLIVVVASIVIMVVSFFLSANPDLSGEEFTDIFVVICRAALLSFVGGGLTISALQFKSLLAKIAAVPLGAGTAFIALFLGGSVEFNITLAVVGAVLGMFGKME